MAKTSSRRQEERLSDDMKEFGGSRIPLSGAGGAEKLDVKLDNFLMSLKTTKGRRGVKSFSITAAEWEEVSEEACLQGKIPSMVNQLENIGVELVSLSVTDFKGLLKELSFWKKQAHRYAEVACK